MNFIGYQVHAFPDLTAELSSLELSTDELRSSGIDECSASPERAVHFSSQCYDRSCMDKNSVTPAGFLQKLPRVNRLALWIADTVSTTFKNCLSIFLGLIRQFIPWCVRFCCLLSFHRVFNVRQESLRTKCSCIFSELERAFIKRNETVRVSIWCSISKHIGQFLLWRVRYSLKAFVECIEKTFVQTNIEICQTLE